MAVFDPLDGPIARLYAELLASALVDRNLEPFADDVRHIFASGTRMWPKV
ncbi:MAG: hypothetical protein M3472_08810 [Chloroflexota bacterium]|nr:hypothetical protein [Chloroflexota bacterium]